MTALKVLYASVVTAAAAVVVAVEGVPRPESFWPTSWVALMTAVTVTLGALTAIITRIMGLHRWGQKGIYDRLERMEAAAQLAAKESKELTHTIREHFDTQLSEFQDHYDRRLDRMEHEVEARMDRFTLAVKERLDGFGGRLGQVETVQDEQRGVMSASVEDRRHLNNSLERMETELRAMRELLIKTLKPTRS